METKRYWELNRLGKGITTAEAAKGWHFCPDWDLLLIGPEMESEWECCMCEKHHAS